MEIPVPKKSAYQRPYKTRSERREADRRKYDESSDYKFLMRVAAGLVLAVGVAVAIALKGFLD